MNELYPKTDRVVVVGANGMIGSYMISHLVENGYTNIVAVVRDKYRCGLIGKIAQLYSIVDIFDKIEIVELDCGDYSVMHNFFEEGDIVYNMASPVSLCDKDIQIVEDSIRLSYSIAQSAKEAKVRVIVHTSSISTLKSENITTEKSLPDTILYKSLYSQSKFYSEGEFWRAFYGGLNLIVVNPSVVLGVGDWSGESSAAIFRRLSKGCFATTKGTTGYIGARDCVKSMEILTHNKSAIGERYILNGENLSYKEFTNMVVHKFGKNKPIFIVPNCVVNICATMAKVLCKLRVKLPLSHSIIKGLAEECNYENRKIKELLKIDFTPIETAIDECVEQYKKDNR